MNDLIYFSPFEEFSEGLGIQWHQEFITLNPKTQEVGIHAFSFELGNEEEFFEPFEINSNAYFQHQDGQFLVVNLEDGKEFWLEEPSFASDLPR